MKLSTGDIAVLNLAARLDNVVAELSTGESLVLNFEAKLSTGHSSVVSFVSS